MNPSRSPSPRRGGRGPISNSKRVAVVVLVACVLCAALGRWSADGSRQQNAITHPQQAIRMPPPPLQVSRLSLHTLHFPS